MRYVPEDDLPGKVRSVGRLNFASHSVPYRSQFNPVSPYKDFLKGACAVFGGYLWSLSNNQTGIIAMKESGVVLRGGATYGASFNTGNILHPTGDGTADDLGAGLYASTYGTKAEVTYTGKVGTFTMGELVEQAVSLAKGCVYQDSAGVLSIQTKEGTFDDTNVITGGTSGATCTASAVTLSATRRFLEFSPDGFTNFKTCADVNDTVDGSGFLPRCLVDCGVQVGPILGTSNTRLLIYAEYTHSDYAPRIIINQPDVDRYLWTPIIQADRESSVSSVRHFHGAVWSSVHEKLFILGGDTDSQSCILVCDDVADMCANPGTWKTRWALDKFGTDRTAYLTTGAGAPYNVINGNQQARSVDLVLDADQDFGYYIPDQALGGANVLIKVNLATNTYQRGTTVATGTGWVGCRTADGTVILSCASDYGQQGVPAYAGNNDGYCRLYAVVPETLDLVEIHKNARRDIADPLYPSATFYGTVVQFGGGPNGGPIWAWDYSRNLWDGDVVGAFSSGPSAAFKPPESQFGPGLTGVNLLYNGSFEEGDPNLSNLIEWVATRCDQTLRDQSTVDSAQGALYSFRIRPAAAVAGTAVITYSLKQRAIYAARGHYMTFKVRILAKTTLASTQIPYISITTGTEISTYVLPEGLKSDSWQTISITHWVPTNANSLTLTVGARQSGLDVGDVWISDAALVFGTQPPVAGSPSINNLLAFLPGFAMGGTYATVLNATYVMTDFESSQLFLEFGGTPSGAQDVTLPLTSKQFRPWYVYNNSGQILTFKVAGQATGIAVGAGKRCILARDATNMVRVTADNP